MRRAYSKPTQQIDRADVPYVAWMKALHVATFVTFVACHASLDPTPSVTVRNVACNGVEAHAMLVALHASCASSQQAGCASLERELGSCALRFWEPRDAIANGSIAAGDTHGGYWHAVIFAPTSSGYRVVGFDGGDVY